jgi:hypothetical protein
MAAREPVEVTVEIGGQEVVAGTLREQAHPGLPLDPRTTDLDLP